MDTQNETGPSLDKLLDWRVLGIAAAAGFFGGAVGYFVAHRLFAAQGLMSAQLALGTLGGAGAGGATGWGLAKQALAGAEDLLGGQQAQVEAVQAENQRLKTALRRLETRLDDLAAAGPAHEPLELEAVHGIGPVYADQLRAAGITTLAELAAQTVERVKEIIGRGTALTDASFRAWIAEAASLAQAGG